MTQNNNDGIGYGRPPKATQFLPGQSGNKSGRPKGRRNFITELRAELNSTTTVTENGQRLTVTKQLAVIKNLIAAAMDGDMRATTAVLALCTRIAEDDDALDRHESSPDDLEILEMLDSQNPVDAAGDPGARTSDADGPTK
ncbi:MAG: DUF5681 domain-containing protein [Stellaceae bacterium]|jgi:hypothetical protein